MRGADRRRQGRERSTSCSRSSVPTAQELVASSDPATAPPEPRGLRRPPPPSSGGSTIAAPTPRSWSSATRTGRFPIPLVKDANGWRFDTAAGKEEVLARRIGRNELAAIDICRAYVAAQRRYARARPRRQAGRPLRAHVSQRSGQAERPVLAGQARRAAQPARRPGRGGGRGRLRARRERRSRRRSTATTSGS